MKLFHGTSSALMDDITREGLLSPYLTSREDIALYYAECAAEEEGGEEVVLAVEVDESSLRYDRSAMEELVMVSAQERDAEWERAEAEHPEWAQDGYLSIPPSGYLYSLRGVASVRYEGVITQFMNE